MPKTNLKTLAYHHIRQKIITCEYAPGAFLNEEMLTEDMNLSRTPGRSKPPGTGGPDSDPIQAWNYGYTTFCQRNKYDI